MLSYENNRILIIARTPIFARTKEAHNKLSFAASIATTKKEHFSNHRDRDQKLKYPESLFPSSGNESVTKT